MVKGASPNLRKPVGHFTISAVRKWTALRQYAARYGDLDRTVARSAACALGRLGRTEARPALMDLLRSRPSEDVIGSVSSIADEECMVLLGRIARSTPGLADAALDALESIDDARADAIAAAVRRLQRSSATLG
jgi:hypothetical protein